MPEFIVNEDGNSKQDCELNAAKRLLPKLKHYGLDFIITGDALYAKDSLIKAIKEEGFNFFLTFKGENRSLTQQIKQAKNLRSKEEVIGKKKYSYQWIKNMSLNLDKDSEFVNYFSLEITNIDTGKIFFSSSWISDLKWEDLLHYALDPPEIPSSSLRTTFQSNF